MKTETVKRRKRYTPEFKARALELCAMGKPTREVAEDLCISQDLIYSWKRTAEQASQGGSAAQGAGGDESEADELRRLRREVADLRIDNDILKKAAVIMGTKPQPRSGK
jgi:transposase